MKVVLVATMTPSTATPSNDGSASSQWLTAGVVRLEPFSLYVYCCLRLSRGCLRAPPWVPQGGPLFYWPFCCPEPLAVPPGFLGGSASPFDSTASCAFCNSPSARLALRSPSLLGFAQHFCMHSGRVAAAAHAFLGHPGRLGFPVPPGVAAVRSSCRRQTARPRSRAVF